MRGSRRSRRLKRHHAKTMRKAGMLPCGCCWVYDDRRRREIAAALADIRTEAIGGRVKL